MKLNQSSLVSLQLFWIIFLKQYIYLIAHASCEQTKMTRQSNYQGSQCFQFLFSSSSSCVLQIHHPPHPVVKVKQHMVSSVLLCCNSLSKKNSYRRKRGYTKKRVHVYTSNSAILLITNNTKKQYKEIDITRAEFVAKTTTGLPFEYKLSKDSKNTFGYLRYLNTFFQSILKVCCGG